MTPKTPVNPTKAKTYPQHRRTRLNYNPKYNQQLSRRISATHWITPFDYIEPAFISGILASHFRSRILAVINQSRWEGIGNQNLRLNTPIYRDRLP